MSVEAGQKLSHYRLTEKIGAGGMGVVYRARDERLRRDVAIKVLPPGTLTDESTRKRFRKEAFALSKLNHPNIETVPHTQLGKGQESREATMIFGIHHAKTALYPPIEVELIEREVETH